MCFVIDRNYASKKTTTSLKKCYKVVKKGKNPNTFTSFYKNFPYCTGTVYKTKFTKLYNDYLGLDFIEEGFHAYTNIEAAKRSVEGFCTKTTIVECLIPLNTKYYTNPIVHEIVSERIIICREI